MSFSIDAEVISKMRQGFYSDAYFTNIAKMLNVLSEESYTLTDIAIGDLKVEMQIFARRKPMAVVAGMEEALAILRACTGYYSGENFINTYEELEVEAVEEGTIVYYEGNPSHIKPILKIKGKYAHFAMLETVILGVLTEATRLATNAFEVLQVSNGKEILFFPARFAHYSLQASHGYAYKTAIDTYNKLYDKKSLAYISTDEQGRLWGGHGGGTTAHANIAVFLGNTAEMMLQFARILPAQIPRIALVDFHNDCVGETKKVMLAMFKQYYQLRKRGEEAQNYKLFGIRTDTSGNMMDKSIQPLGDKKLDCGVNPRLINNIKKAIEEAYQEWDWLDEEGKELAKSWSKDIKIVVTGGFDKKRIANFEELNVPVDIYGVGSSLLSNCSYCGTSSDYTADLVKAQINGQWKEIAKKGRKSAANPQLKKIN